MKRAKWCGILIAVLALAGRASALTVDFEDWAGGPSPQDVVVSHGFGFYGGSLSISPTPGSDNVTNVLHVGGTDTKMASVALSTFDAVAVDLQEGLGDVAAVTLVGYRAGSGWVVSQTLPLDGDVATFETFNLAGFSGIDMLFFYGYDAQGAYSSDFAIDNLVAPEPHAAILVSLAGIIAVCARRRTN